MVERVVEHLLRVGVGVGVTVRVRVRVRVRARVEGVVEHRGDAQPNPSPYPGGFTPWRRSALP